MADDAAAKLAIGWVYAGISVAKMGPCCRCGEGSATLGLLCVEQRCARA
jgi:hypothetical protein